MLFSLVETEKGLFEELFEYFSKKYFTVEMPYFENFSIRTNALFSFQIIIIGLTIGVILASAASVYNKRHLGGFIRKLIDTDTMSADSAKTLEELGYRKNIGVRRVIKSGGTLSRWARCREEDEYIAEMEKKKEEFDDAHKNDPKPPKFKEIGFKRDCDTMHFYLPEEKQYAAEIKFDAKGAGWGAVIIVAIFAVILCMILCYFLPDVLKFVDNFISVMNK